MLILSVAFIFHSKASANIHRAHYNVIADSTQKKIKHPTEAMTDAQLNTILSHMQQKANDTEKIEVLKSGIAGNGITVEQLIQLLNQFLTDDAKLTSTEYAYPYTVNYKAILKVQDIFASEEPKAALQEFLKKNK